MIIIITINSTTVVLLWNNTFKGNGKLSNYNNNNNNNNNNKNKITLNSTTFAQDQNIQGNRKLFFIYFLIIFIEGFIAQSTTQAFH